MSEPSEKSLIKISAEARKAADELRRQAIEHEPDSWDFALVIQCAMDAQRSQDGEDAKRLDWLEQQPVENQLKMPMWESQGNLREAIDAAQAKGRKA